uniref:Translational activator GCN1 n=1 Tax=Lygus hesperus TaxID=30085 RepID=A0A0A9Z7U3_LYGHE
MRSPSTETESALDALLYTRFVNLVDPASLALIIPVISRGLNGQQPQTRPKAAQIVASMVHLVGDAQTLAPYAEDLVKLLEEAAQDPQAESRTTAARALGVLASAMSNTLVDKIASWCLHGVL